MAMGRVRHIKLLMAVLLLLTLAKGSNCNRTCTVADLEIRHIQVDSYKHGDRTTQEQQQHMNSAGGGRKLKQMPMIMAVWVYNVVIYAPDGFSTIYANGTDERIFSKVREHLYLIPTGVGSE